MNSNEALKKLDGLRGLAALYVLIHHARLILTQPYFEGFLKHPEMYNLVDKLFVYSSAAFKFGHEAVILFFVLSGFVIHLKQARELGQTQSGLNLKSYLFKRFLRIYPTLVAALLLSVLLDIILANITGRQNLFYKYKLIPFLQNFLLIPDSVSWGNNYPLWSLKHEWFFYLVYPFLVALTRKNYLYPLIFSFFLFFVYLLGVKIPLIDMAAYTLSIWWMGGILAEVYYGRYNFKMAQVIYAIPLGIFLVLLSGRSETFHDLGFGLIFSGIISIILSGKLSRLTNSLNYFTFIGTFSYSIYLLHFPLMTFGKNLIVYFSSSHALPYHFWYVLLGTVLTLIVTYFIYSVTEKPFQLLKSRLFR